MNITLHIYIASSAFYGALMGMTVAFALISSFLLIGDFMGSSATTPKRIALTYLIYLPAAAVLGGVWGAIVPLWFIPIMIFMLVGSSLVSTRILQPSRK